MRRWKALVELGSNVPLSGCGSPAVKGSHEGDGAGVFMALAV